MNTTIELRFVYDCENLSNNLEYRQVCNGQPVTRWMKVPSVYPKAGDYVDPPFDMNYNYTEIK